MTRRTHFYSFTLLISGAAMAIFGHVDMGILNALAAIWLKMLYPEGTE